MARETAIFTNMCMIEDNAGQVLVQDRQDPGWPGLVFPGGHVEAGESFVESVIREVEEETGLTVVCPRLVGLKQFMLKDGTRYVVLLFKARKFSGELHGSREGDVYWLPKEELTQQRMVEGFFEMLRVFEDDTLTEMQYIHDGEESYWKFF